MFSVCLILSVVDFRLPWAFAFVVLIGLAGCAVVAVCVSFGVSMLALAGCVGLRDWLLIVLTL